jgi:hypothetical protein
MPAPITTITDSDGITLTLYPPSHLDGKETVVRVFVNDGTEVEVWLTAADVTELRLALAAYDPEEN